MRVARLGALFAGTFTTLLAINPLEALPIFLQLADGKDAVARRGMARLASADRIMRRLGPQGIDAISRLVGFFVSTMEMGLVFHGLTDFLGSFGIVPKLMLSTVAALR